MAQTFIYGEDDRVATWVGAMVGCTFRNATAIGIERSGSLVAGVVYDRFSGNDICMHVAAKPGVRWLNRESLYRFFAYPFVQIGCTRVTGLVAADNLVAQEFDEHLGFVKEGVLRKGMPDGTDLFVYGMLRDECKWIKR